MKEYDAESRVNRGVYYTPPAIVQFIVSQVSNILDEDFNLSGGLANQKVKLLDFACGTGTFLFESYKNVLAGTQSNSFEQNELIEHLLKNFYGFEIIMISSYIISHLKLSQFLKEKGYDITAKANKRIGIYLTNTLENKKDIEANLFAKAVAEEGKKANAIKDDKEIIAIIGNPPYNVSSQNILHDTNDLKAFHQKYKPLDEKNINSLSDDYIKFIAFAHNKINKAGSGVVGMIVNNSFLKGLTHRKMRNELMKDFDKIYIVDLHGNARIGETAEDGSADQNVFDIMQGVCIILLVKNAEIKNKGVFHLDLYGKRKEKFKRLYEIDRKDFAKLEITDFNEAFRSTKWGKERFQDDLSFFAQMNEATAMLEYGKFWGLTDIFEHYNSGVTTSNDEKYVHFQDDFNGTIENYEQEKVKDISYRPFDNRKIYYDLKLLDRPRFETMQHMLNGDNIGLVFERVSGIHSYNHIFISNALTECHLTGAKSYLAPLYLHRITKTATLGFEEEDKKPNFKPEFARMVAEKFENPTPEEILAFIYASMHSPLYRTKYLELLKIDFPRINFDVSRDEFKRLSTIGQELIDAHLMKKIPALKIGSCISTIGFEKITCQKPSYNEEEKRIYIGKEVYFDGVNHEVWQFKIGGYQVLDKYIKERFDRVLTPEEIKNITNIIKVLAFTIEKMAEVDES